jgi:hypothetical protein
VSNSVDKIDKNGLTISSWEHILNYFQMGVSNYFRPPIINKTTPVPGMFSVAGTTTFERLLGNKINGKPLQVKVDI